MHRVHAKVRVVKTVFLENGVFQGSVNGGFQTVVRVLSGEQIPPPPFLPQFNPLFTSILPLFNLFFTFFNLNLTSFVHNSVCSQFLAEGLFAILAECSQFFLRSF